VSRARALAAHLAVCVAGACAAPPPPAPPAALPQWLSEVGLYDDVSALELASDAQPYSPRYPLWSDGSEKLRWLILPDDTAIDTADVDHWRFPVGTRAFKEFRRDGRPIETRVAWRVADTGRREEDTLLGTYVWGEGELDARLTVDGVVDARGTAHDVPPAEKCWHCHLGEPGHILGISAVQLAPGALARAPALPSAPAVAPALGYLHGNCGHCHNVHGKAWSDTDLVLKLDVTAESRAMLSSTVDQASVGPGSTPGEVRVVPGAPERSAVLTRMRERGSPTQMPPLGSEDVDADGVATVRAWLLGL